MIDWLIDCLIDWLIYLCDCLIGWLVDWLIDFRCCFMFWFIVCPSRVSRCCSPLARWGSLDFKKVQLLLLHLLLLFLFLFLCQLVVIVSMNAVASSGCSWARTRTHARGDARKNVRIYAQNTVYFQMMCQKLCQNSVWGWGSLAIPLLILIPPTTTKRKTNKLV